MWHMVMELRKHKGVTLIELLIALAVSAIIVVALYRAFISHQRSYAVQEQVADMQQNVRVAINKMMREIRMAGFGGKNDNTGGDNDIIKVFGNVNGFINIINPGNDVMVDGIKHDQIVVVAAYDQIAALEKDAPANSNSFKVNFTGSTRFDKPWRKYVCIDGRNNYPIIPTDGDVLTLEGGATLKEKHSAGEPVFLVKAIRYGLRKDNRGIQVLFRDLYPNTGGSNRETLAENIEDLQFKYVLKDQSEADSPANPADIRMVRVMITARTSMRDPNYKGGLDYAEGEGSYRVRRISSNIQIRNVGVD